MKTTTLRLFVIQTLLTFVLMGKMTAAVQAEEAGKGHYLPGATASFIDALPGRPSFAYLNDFTYYNGSADRSRSLQLGGVLAAKVEATTFANTSIFLYEGPWNIFGGYYAAALAIPYVWMTVKGEVEAGSAHRSRRDTADGIGDIEIIPFMLGWKQGDFKYDVRFAVYAPTGNFKKGDLANVGNNYWTFEPLVSFSYLSSKIGLEITGFAGVDLNTKNHDTEYQTGDQFHLDLTVAEHLPLFGGFVGVGANAFYYKQFTGDSGSGARLGGFQGMTVGVGPVLSYTRKICRTDLVAEVKWLPELESDNRLNGDFIWFKLALVF